MRADALDVLEQAAVEQLIHEVEPARQASRLPPYVLPWSPGDTAAAIRSRTSAAPIGTPPPSALPIAIRSGARPSSCA